MRTCKSRVGLARLFPLSEKMASVSIQYDSQLKATCATLQPKYRIPTRHGHPSPSHSLIFCTSSFQSTNYDTGSRLAKAPAPLTNPTKYRRPQPTTPIFLRQFPSIRPWISIRSSRAIAPTLAPSLYDPLYQPVLSSIIWMISHKHPVFDSSLNLPCRNTKRRQARDWPATHSLRNSDIVTRSSPSSPCFKSKQEHSANSEVAMAEP